MKRLKFFQQLSITNLPRWLRRKLKRLRSGFSRIPKAITRTVAISVLLVGVFIGSGPPEAMAQTNITINNEKRDGGQWVGPSGSQTWQWNGTYNTFTGNFFGRNSTDNVIAHLNTSNGGTVTLTNTVSPTVANQYRYTADWSQTYGPNGGMAWNAGSVANGMVSVTSGRTTTLNDTRNAAYTINYLGVNGGGALTLTGGSTSYTSDIFTGDAGTLNVSVAYNSTTANVGNGGTFTGNVASGVTWTTTTVNASGTFTKSGAGTLSSTNTTITGTSLLTGGGNWWVTNTLQVGNGATAGILNITNGTMGANATTGTPTANVGSTTGTGAGTVTVGGSGTWRTVAANIGNTGTGTVNNNAGTWYSTGLTRIGIDNTGTVNTSGIWNAAGQEVRVGAGWYGFVNQSGGTWTNEFTNVGAVASTNSEGAVTQTGGTHNDVYARIGNLTGGTYELGGTGATAAWNTSGSIAGLTGVGAQIGAGTSLNNDFRGLVTVGSNGTWTISQGLTVSEYARGILSVWNGGITNVNGTNHTGVAGVGMIIGNQNNSIGTTRVTGSGSQLNVAAGLINANLAGARGSLYVDSGGVTSVGGNHIIANETGTQGRDHIDGNNSRLQVTGNMTVGNQGQAGTLPVNFSHDPVYRDGTLVNAWSANNGSGYITITDPTNWWGSTNMGGSGTFPAAPNVPNQSGSVYNSYPFTANAPGLAITHGGVVTVAGNASVAVGSATNRNIAYTVIDNRGAGSPTRSTWDITGTLVLSDYGYSYTRVVDGGLLRTGQALTMANQAGSTAVLDVYGTYNSATPSQLTVSSGGFTVAERGQAAFNLFDNARATITGGSIVANIQGSRGTVNIHSGGGETVNGDMIIANQRGTRGDVNVWGTNSFLTVNGDLMTGQDNGTGTGFSQGNLYAWGGSTITVTGDHTIADGINALGRDYIDMYGTRMIVTGDLTVGNEGQAGGTYSDNHYDSRFEYDPASGLWLDGLTNTFHSRTELGSIDQAKGVVARAAGSTGNDPGLAVTRGAWVTSGRGVLGVSNNGDPTDPSVNGQPTSGGYGDWSNGYAVIDNRGNTAGNAYNPALIPIGNGGDGVREYIPEVLWDVRPGFLTYNYTQWMGNVSTWEVQNDLVVAEDGNGYARVLNGGLLVTGTVGTNTDGASTIIGEGGGRGVLFVGNGDYDPDVTVNAIGGRSVWVSLGATSVGDGALSRGTIRINDGALGVTAGLYLGTGAGSEGEVSVMGQNSTLHITQDVGSVYLGVTPMAGSGLFSASNHSLTWMDAGSEIRLNGIAQISTGSILHLDGAKDPSGSWEVASLSGTDPIFDMGTKRMTVTNGRVEGIGLITGADGVHFRSDPAWTQVGFANNLNHLGIDGHAEIDPGLFYGWEHPCEMDYYGTLRFGHTLSMTGNVVTYFDVNAGYSNEIALGDLPPWVQGYVPDPWAPEQDHIIVQGDTNNTTDQVVASLGGTLLLHARLTDYFDNDLEYDIVTTVGANGLKGLITSEFDELRIRPSRFFVGAEQWIWENGNGDDVLSVRMTLNESPFELSGTTYNERSTGRALDSIYALRDQAWLPFLRHFWYIEDDEEFRNAIRLYSGEVRAHSLLMPLQSPWTYAHERNGFSRCTGHAIFGPQNRNCNITSGRNIWGTFIHTNNSTDSDGNAGDYDLKRNGFVVGYERASKGGLSYLGAMFAYNQGKLNTWRADAKSDDFQFGLYHGKNICDTWEWKNYLGIGIQDYRIRRDIDLDVNEYYLDGTRWVCDPRSLRNRYMISDFAGLTFAGSTELARPFYFGKCCQWTLRPYMGLDLMAVWQNRASEHGDFDDTYEINGQQLYYRDLVALDYHSATNVRMYGRPGVTLERGGSNGNLRMGVSYSYLMGGHRYTNVDNQFQFGGDKFNIRGVDDGSGFVTANVGAAAYLGKRKLSMVYIDYAVLAGSHSTTHAGQLGFQTNF